MKQLLLTGKKFMSGSPNSQDKANKYLVKKLIKKWDKDLQHFIIKAIGFAVLFFITCLAIIRWL